MEYRLQKLVSNSNLSADVLDAVKAGRKIETIKLLRSTPGIDLKEAKQQVDAHIAGPPEPGPVKTFNGGDLLFKLVLFMPAVHPVYRFLS